MLFRSYTVLVTPQQNSSISCSQATHNSAGTGSHSPSTATFRAAQNDRCSTPVVSAQLPSSSGRDTSTHPSSLASLGAARQQVARPVASRRPASRVPVIQPGGRTSCRLAGTDTDGHRRRAAAGAAIFHLDVRNAVVTCEIK